MGFSSSTAQLRIAVILAAVAGAIPASAAAAADPPAAAQDAAASRPLTLRKLGVRASAAVVRERTLTLRFKSRRPAKLRFKVLQGRKVLAKAKKTFPGAKRKRTIRAQLNRTPQGRNLRLRVDVRIGKRHGRATLKLRLIGRTPAPSGPGTAPPRAPGVGPYAAGNCPKRSFPRDLNALVRSLPPGGDPDGDGFSTARELGQFAFDPVAAPDRFNPLIADVPEVDVDINGDIGIAVIDHLDNGSDLELGTVGIDEQERTEGTVNTDSRSTTDTHSVSVSIDSGLNFNASYSYSHSTTQEKSVQVSAQDRRAQTQQLSDIKRSHQGNTVDSGELTVEATLTNTGHVSYKVLNSVMVARYRDAETGQVLPYGSLHNDYTPDTAPTLAPGQTKTVLFSMTGIGASDILELVEDASTVEFEITDLKLTEIGLDGFRADAGDFTKYTDTVAANTAALTMDFGQNRPTEQYLVSTTFLRNPDGSPAGTSLCDALTLLLGRRWHTSAATFPGSKRSVDALTSLQRADTVDVPASAVPKQYWITDVTPAAVAHAPVFGVSDVRLRARQAVNFVLNRDGDGDGIEHRTEFSYGSSDASSDTDGDGRTDVFEAEVGWNVKTERVGTVAAPGFGGPPEYHTLSDPASADADADASADADELSWKSDPARADTDADGLNDGPDARPVTITALSHYLFQSFQAIQGGVRFSDVLGTHSGLDTCVGGNRGLVGGISGAGNNAFRAAPVSGAACEAMNGSAWPFMPEHGFTVAGWVNPYDPGLGNGQYRKTWVLGIPGKLALEVRLERRDNELIQIPWVQVVPAPCVPVTASCGSPPPASPKSLDEGGKPYYARVFADEGPWMFVAMSVWPGSQAGQGGSWVLVRAGSQEQRTFVPGGFSWDGDCRVVVASRTNGCRGSELVPAAENDASYTWMTAVGTGPIAFGPSQSPGLTIDTLQVVGSAFDSDRITRLRNQNY